MKSSAKKSRELWEEFSALKPEGICPIAFSYLKANELDFNTMEDFLSFMSEQNFVVSEPVFSSCLKEYQGLGEDSTEIQKKREKFDVLAIFPFKDKGKKACIPPCDGDISEIWKKETCWEKKLISENAPEEKIIIKVCSQY